MMHRYQNAIDALNNGGTVAIIGHNLSHAREIRGHLYARVNPLTTRTSDTHTDFDNGAYIVLTSPRALTRLEGLITDHVISVQEPNAMSIADHLTAIRNIPADTGNTWITP